MWATGVLEGIAGDFRALFLAARTIDGVQEVSMPRANRYFVPGYACHLTHRCHNREFLLRFAKDRDRYRMLLREGVREVEVSLLDFCVRQVDRGRT